MKRITKILAGTALAALIGTGTCFAKGKDNMEKNGRDFGRMNPPEMAEDGTMVRPADYIAQVASVDTKNGTIKVVDVDGKEETVLVNPFTHIIVDGSRDEKTIADIQKGSWIMYSFYNTETEKKIASRILVK